MRKIIVTESQLKRLLNKVINESSMDVEEKLDYEGFSQGDDLQQLRDAIDRNVLVSVAFVKKDGTVRHMAIKKSLSSYVGSDREKSEKQINVEMNNNIKKVVVEQLEVEDPDTVIAEASFANDLKADSLDVVELVMALEEEFDIEIPDDAAEQIDTVGKAVEYINEKVGATA